MYLLTRLCLKATSNWMVLRTLEYQFVNAIFNVYFMSKKVMAKSIGSLIKTVKEIEDENRRGTNALEVAIDSIEQELNTFNSNETPKKKFSAEDLIKATRPITDATGKAVVAGNNLKQDDIVAAANTGRKAICDLLVTCKVCI